MQGAPTDARTRCEPAPGDKHLGQGRRHGAQVEPSALGLLDLPSPLLQTILASSGATAAACSCKRLSAAVDGVLAHAPLAARLLLARHGPATALYHVYASEGLRKSLRRAAQSVGTPFGALVEALVVELLQQGAQLRPQVRFLLTAAARAGDARALRALLCCGGAEAIACGGRALVAASAAGKLGALRELLHAGVSARSENGGALVAAAREGHFALVVELLQAGADPRAGGGRALAEAVAAGHACVVLALLAVAGAQQPPRVKARSGGPVALAAGGTPTAVSRHAAGGAPACTASMQIAQPLGA